MFAMENAPRIWRTARVLLWAATWTQSSAALLSTGKSPPAQLQNACNSSSFNKNYQLGQKSLVQGQASASLPYLKRAHQICPSDYPAGRDLIVAYGKAGLLQEARAVAEGMLLDRDVAELRALLGELLAEGGDLRSAAEQYQKAAQLDPSEDNIFDFGSSLLKVDGNSALRIFRFGVEKYPDSEKMHLGLGTALYGQGLVDEGVTEAYRASQLNPKDAKAMEVLGQMAHIPATMSSAILERLSALRALYPRNARLTYYYAMVLSGRWSGEPASDFAQVMDLLKTAANLDPSLAEAHFQLGEFYEEQGQPLGALHAYMKAAKLDPQQESYHYRLALAYKKCGNRDEFRREMQIYRKLHGSEK
jgi:tetratricopeptide (TPR) repeat protein